jgi:transketolase
MSLTITSADIRAWSMMGTRGTFGVALLKLAETDDRLVGLTADLAITSGLERFSRTYPDRFFNLGIAEQNLVGVAAGLASQGMVPFATTFANFAALRACEQMRHYLGYLQENVKVVGLASGFAMGMFGTTHYGIEDIATLRAIPGLTILSPADATATAQMTALAAAHPGPVYLRLTGGMRTPVVYREPTTFEVGKANTLREGDDIAIIATGSMVSVALKSAEMLAEQGIQSSVIDMHTIKPLDTQTLSTFLGHRLLVTLEEHSVIGGLGSAVAEYLVPRRGTPGLLTLGIPQCYGPVGEYNWMLEQNGLTADSVTKKIVDGCHE